jgi:pyruvate dehydrogenase E1 component beta subunit
VATDVIADAVDFAARLGGGRPVVRRQLGAVTGAGLAAFTEGVVVVDGSPGEAYRRAPAGVAVVTPSTPADAKGLLVAAAFHDAPVLFVAPDWLPVGDVPDGDWRVPLGVAAVRRAGRDVTVIAYGRQVNDALAAADAWSARGIELEVLDVRTLAPVDDEALAASVARTRNAVVLHEGDGRGFAADVAARLYEDLFAELERPVVRVAPADLTQAIRQLTT